MFSTFIHIFVIILLVASAIGVSLLIGKSLMPTPPEYKKVFAFPKMMITGFCAIIIYLIGIITIINWLNGFAMQRIDKDAVKYEPIGEQFYRQVRPK